tara:strand:- start:2947 stop:3336 length:390 start_codon:yes stop_codon:yes gene_type:complete
MPPFLSISEQTTDVFESSIFCDRRFGADLRFLGVVRHLENGREILGIDYSCYQQMAEQKLEEIYRELSNSESEHRVWVHHRIGFVKAGEASIVIRIQTPHSAEGYAISQAYLRQIKTTVPIWKKPVFSE